MIAPKDLWIMLRSKVNIVLAASLTFLLSDGKQLYIPVEISTHQLAWKYPLALDRMLRHRLDP